MGPSINGLILIEVNQGIEEALHCHRKNTGFGMGRPRLGGDLGRTGWLPPRKPFNVFERHVPLLYKNRDDNT